MRCRSIVNHGWPGSIIEQLKIVERLTDPRRTAGAQQDAFHVVIPSMPGYGFSGKPTSTGWGPERMARAWAELMKRLGYAATSPKAATGARSSSTRWACRHLRDCSPSTPTCPPPFRPTSTRPRWPASRRRPALGRGTTRLRAADQDVRAGRVRQDDGGAPADPVRHRGFTRRPGRLAPRPQRCRRPAGRGGRRRARPDHERHGRADAGRGPRQHHALLADEHRSLRVSPLLGVQGRLLQRQGRRHPGRRDVFPGEQYQAPRSWAEQAYPNLIYFNEVDKGGHFAAWEQPQLFSEELRAAFRSLRRRREVLMSSTVETATEIRPFHVEIPRRNSTSCAAASRRRAGPARSSLTDRSQGVQLATIQELARYWTTEYDWRKAEARLNALPQFTTEIDGVDIHFIHVQVAARERVAADHDARLARLGHRAARDHRPADRPDRARRRRPRTPSTWCCRPCPATASRASRPSSAGTPAASRRAWAELMRRLGYTRYVAQGGDVGAIVTDVMGRQAPEGLLGIHMNLLVTALASDPPPGSPSEERAALDAVNTFTDERLRLLPGAVHAAADDRLRPAGFTRRAGGLDARPRHGQLLEDLPRLRRRRARGQSHPGQHRRQHHAVLADGHRRLGGPVVLGGRTSRGCSPRPARLLRRSRFRSASPPSPARSGGPRAAGSSSPTPTSPTSTRSTRAATSPPGRSRSSSPKSCGLRSAHCAKTPSTSALFGRRSHASTDH